MIFGSNWGFLMMPNPFPVSVRLSGQKNDDFVIRLPDGVEQETNKLLA